MISKLISVLYCARVCVCVCACTAFFCRSPMFYFRRWQSKSCLLFCSVADYSPPTFSQLSLPISYFLDFPVVTMILLSRASLSFLWHLCQRNLLRAEVICSLRFWLSRPSLPSPAFDYQTCALSTPHTSRLISVLSDTSNIYGCLQLENATAPLVPGIPLFLRKGKMKFERKRKKKINYTASGFLISTGRTYQVKTKKVTVSYLP